MLNSKNLIRYTFIWDGGWSTLDNPEDDGKTDPYGKEDKYSSGDWLGGMKDGDSLVPNSTLGTEWTLQIPKYINEWNVTDK